MRWETKYDLALLTVFVGILLIAVGGSIAMIGLAKIWFGVVMPPNDIASPGDAAEAFGSMVGGLLAAFIGTAGVVWGRRHTSKLKESAAPTETALRGKAPRK